MIFTRRKVLIVDDQPQMRELVSAVLARHRIMTLEASGGAQMDEVLARESVDLIILDAMMPHEDGFSICKRLQASVNIPIIMLSAKDRDADKIMGLNLGAEDYISKPFNPDELIARIKVVLRRTQRTDDALKGTLTEWVYGWQLDRVKRAILSPSGTSVALSSAEFAVLRVFIAHPDRVLSREFILSHMTDWHEASTPRALDTLISRLRRKLAKADSQAKDTEGLIHTVYGRGYALRPPH